ncbi:MAG: hypothetical protein R3F17_01985 [Planctomycetota bacterium]
MTHTGAWGDTMKELASGRPGASHRFRPGPGSMGKPAPDISDAISTLEGSIVCLYDPSHPVRLRAARTAGGQQFVAYPAPSELVLCTLQGT